MVTMPLEVCYRAVISWPFLVSLSNSYVSGMALPRICSFLQSLWAGLQPRVQKPSPPQAQAVPWSLALVTARGHLCFCPSSTDARS